MLRHHPRKVIAPGIEYTHKKTPKVRRDMLSKVCSSGVWLRGERTQNPTRKGDTLKNPPDNTLHESERSEHASTRHSSENTRDPHSSVLVYEVFSTRQLIAGFSKIERNYLRMGDEQANLPLLAARERQSQFQNTDDTYKKHNTGYTKRTRALPWPFPPARKDHLALPPAARWPP